MSEHKTLDEALRLYAEKKPTAVLPLQRDHSGKLHVHVNIKGAK